MKLTTIIFCLTFFLFGGIASQVYAQEGDAFKTEAEFITKDMGTQRGLLAQDFAFAGPSGTGKNIFVHISAATIKKMQLPKGVKVSKGPVTLKRNGMCYTFACDKNNCSDCKLYWKDRNGDGKVQPRRELRCFCAPKKPCKIRVRKSKC
ncbi:MAG: hypothetical protein AAF696_15310 [Bacteroidota bacterium]